VANGTVIGDSALGYGVRATGADRLSLSRVTTSGYASLHVNGDAVRIVEVTARGFDTSIISNGATIDRLTTTTDLGVSGHAVEVTNGDFRSGAGFRVDDSSLRDNLLDGWGMRGDGNSIVGNQGDGGSFRAGTGNSVRGNRFARLVLEAGFSGNLIEDNSVSDGAGPPEARRHLGGSGRGRQSAGGQLGKWPR
jgi:hypothetical protein